MNRACVGVNNFSRFLGHCERSSGVEKCGHGHSCDRARPPARLALGDIERAHDNHGADTRSQYPGSTTQIVRHGEHMLSDRPDCRAVGWEIRKS